ncbi:THAP domain-containing protein 6-like, partial [Aphis craccivora]
THVFPENDEDFKVWVQRTGNKYIEMMKKESIRKSYRICHLHFEKSCKSPGTIKPVKMVTVNDTLDLLECQPLDQSLIVEASTLETSTNINLKSKKSFSSTNG